MTIMSLASLLIAETKEAIYTTALSIASAIGLPVSSWQPGDPTRSLFQLEAETLSLLETEAVGFVSSGFLDYATGDWLVLLAKQVFNVDVPGATFASTTSLVLTNAGGGVYDIDANDITFKSSLTGKTYHNTTGGHLAGSGGTLTVSVEADEAGSGSSAGGGEIDTLVTTLLGVTCSNTDAATGSDAQAEETTRQQCRDKLGALSPNGPKEAYSYVARNSELTGTTAVTRVRVYPDSDTGEVTVYVAGPSGAIAAPDLALVATAIETYATPICITPTVLSAANVSVDVTYSIWLYKSVNKTAAEVAADVETALAAMLENRPIGGDIIPPATTGKVYHAMVESTIRNTFPGQTFQVTVGTPAGDTSLTNGQVAVLGTVPPPTLMFVADP